MSIERLIGALSLGNGTSLHASPPGTLRPDPPPGETGLVPSHASACAQCTRRPCVGRLKPRSSAPWSPGPRRFGVPSSPPLQFWMFLPAMREKDPSYGRGAFSTSTAPHFIMYDVAYIGV